MRPCVASPNLASAYLARLIIVRFAATKFAVVLLFITIAPSLSPAQDPDEASSQTKILALEHVWNQAEALGDLKALDALFDDRLIYIDYDGRLLTKQEFISQVKSSHLLQVVTDLEKVQVFGDTAIVNGTYRANEFKNGKPLALRGRFTDTWLYRDSTWVCIAAQATPILQ